MPCQTTYPTKVLGGRAGFRICYLASYTVFFGRPCDARLTGWAGILGDVLGSITLDFTVNGLMGLWLSLC